MENGTVYSNVNYSKMSSVLMKQDNFRRSKLLPYKILACCVFFVFASIFALSCYARNFFIFIFLSFCLLWCVWAVFFVAAVSKKKNFLDLFKFTFKDIVLSLLHLLWPEFKKTANDYIYYKPKLNFVIESSNPCYSSKRYNTEDMVAGVMNNKQFYAFNSLFFIGKRCESVYTVVLDFNADFKGCIAIDRYQPAGTAALFGPYTNFRRVTLPDGILANFCVYTDNPYAVKTFMTRELVDRITAFNVSVQSLSCHNHVQVVIRNGKIEYYIPNFESTFKFSLFHQLNEAEFSKMYNNTRASLQMVKLLTAD